MKQGIAVEDREIILEQVRMLKMARSAHAYVRGNTVKFYEWLAKSRAAKRLPEGPAIWICGDCHLGNLGPLADAEGRVDVQIRDLDQAVIGHPEHDLIRLGLSLATAARGSDLPGVTTARMIEEMVDGYEAAMRDPEEETEDEPPVVGVVRRRALGRRWRHLAKERIEDVEPKIPLGKTFWSLAAEERTAIDALFAQEDVRTLVLALNGRDPKASRLRVLDAAYWRKGCSSLGQLRYAVLVGTTNGKKSDERIALVDLKEAGPAAAPVARDAVMPADPAERVVAGARALSPNLGDRMIAATLLGKPIVLRELMPQDLKLEVDQFTRSEAVQAARYLAHVVGRAHARQMDAGTRREWRRLLIAQHGRTIDAPSWLWQSVVDLAAMHEGAYLEHCRRYALAEAA
jgi:uncharacterized protein (DUF2252 family)